MKKGPRDTPRLTAKMWQKMKDQKTIGGVFRDLSIIQNKILCLTATDINPKSTKLHMTSVVHFEIAVDDPERAIKFYSTVFGWKIQKWDQFDYWLAITKHEGEVGIDGALMKRE